MNESCLNAFPGSDIEALALLYVQNQDLKSVTPVELLAMYDNAVETMLAVREAQRKTTENYF